MIDNNIFNLEFDKPTSKMFSVYTDYLELECLLNVDREINLSEYCDDEVKAEEENQELFDDYNVSDPDFHFFYDDHKFGEESDTLLLQTKNHIQNKILYFGKFYPFKLIGNNLKRKKALKNIHHIYIFFLLCSNLQIVNNRTRNKFTSDFEIISSLALEKFLASYEVHIVGKSRNTTLFPSKFFDLVHKIANCLCERCVLQYEDRNSNIGDGGLDIFAFKKPKNDIAPGMPLIFAQCACSKEEWSKKRFESSYSNWKGRINFIHPPTNMLIIPHNHRNIDWFWEEIDKIWDCILFDRFRLCNYLNGNDIDNLSIHDLIKNFVNKRKPF